MPLKPFLINGSLREDFDILKAVSDWLTSRGYTNEISVEYLPFIMKERGKDFSAVFALGPLDEMDPLEMAVLANFVENGGTLVLAHDHDRKGANRFDGRFRVEFKHRRFFTRRADIDITDEHPLFEGIKKIKGKRTSIKDNFEFSKALANDFIKLSLLHKGLVITIGDVWTIDLLGEEIKTGLLRKKTGEKGRVAEFKPVLFENLINFIVHRDEEMI